MSKNWLFKKQISHFWPKKLKRYIYIYIFGKPKSKTAAVSDEKKLKAEPTLKVPYRRTNQSHNTQSNSL